MYDSDMHKEHLTLKPADHDFLSALVSKGKSSAKLFRRATALLELSRGKTVSATAETLQVSRQSVTTWRDKYQSSGLQALEDAPRSGRPIVIDGKGRAAVTALACSTPPEGRARWTLRMLADKAVEWATVRACRTRRRAQYSKKRTPAAPQKDMVHRRDGLQVYCADGAGS
jgi:transposase